MNPNLQRITDWPTRAAAAQWNITTLAANGGVSVTTLERFFHEQQRVCPREWLHAERMRRARELLERHERIKETYKLLGYGHASSFSTAFQKFHGYPPSWHRKGKGKTDKQHL